MPSKKKDPLFRLIKSLTKPEKRHFRLYANRTMGQQTRKFILLFNLLDKSEAYDEAAILQTMGDQTSKGKLPNLKRHLYKQLLTSLRLNHISKQLEFEIREQIDFANILYYKGLYMDSLRILERIKIIARDHHQDILQIEIIHFQKMIESRHITRSRKVDKKLDDLLEESEQKNAMAQASSAMVSFNIKIHGYYIVHGFAQSEADKNALEMAWHQMQPKAFNTAYGDTFAEQLNRSQSKMWYCYIRLDFAAALAHTQLALDYFNAHIKMKSLESNVYIRCLYYQLVFLYLLQDRDAYRHTLDTMNAHIQENSTHFAPIHRQVAFVYQHLSQLNYWLLCKDFKAAESCATTIRQQLPAFRNNLDDHRILLFYYKFAAISFALQQYESALSYLFPLLHHSEDILRQEMDINARLLELMCLFDIQDFDRMGYRLALLGKKLSKVSKPAQLQLASKDLLRDLLKYKDTRSEKIMIQKHLSVFKELAQQPREVLFLTYLDVWNWLRGQLK